MKQHWNSRIADDLTSDNGALEDQKWTLVPQRTIKTADITDEDGSTVDDGAADGSQKKNHRKSVTAGDASSVANNEVVSEYNEAPEEPTAADTETR